MTLSRIVIIGGGQSGLAGARAVREAGLEPLVLEAGEAPNGSWPHYYDSLKAFSPNRFSNMPGVPFPGDPEDYPARDDIATYLSKYAVGLDVEIQTGTSVESVAADGAGYVVKTARGEEIPASGIIAATGSFGNPYVPDLPGMATFGGSLIHSASYRNPAGYRGQRVVVVGGGNSAVQIAYELADVASVTLASRQPVKFIPQKIEGRDVHHTLTAGFDQLPPAWLATALSAGFVLDTGTYQDAFELGRLDRREMFTALDGETVTWSDGAQEPVDAVILATGYRPHLGYLRDLGALDERGLPRQQGGISTTHAGLVYLGLELQRSFASNTLRGVSVDAERVVAPLVAHARGALTAFKS